MNSKDTDPPVHSASIARVLVPPSLDSSDVLEDTSDQQKLIRQLGCAGLSESAGL